MITDQDIKKLSKVFATKKDFKKFATKEDLSGFATKKDLQGFATKKDLDRFATKEDIRQLPTRENVETMIDTATKRIVVEIHVILEMIGEISAKSEQNTEEVQGHRIAIGDHEERIRLLEQPHQ